MAIKDYRFVSPGVQIKEIDQSVLQPTQPEIGPVVIGKFSKGPVFTPTVVSNIDQFREIFGGTITGQESVSDVWREGNVKLAPSYASIAAEAHLDAAVTPVTIVRMLGEQHPNATTGLAGWKVGDPSAVSASNSGVYALVVNNLSNSVGNDIGENGGFRSESYVAAMFYVTGGGLILEGNQLSGSSVVSGSSLWVKSTIESDTYYFTAKVYNAAGSLTSTVRFDLNVNSPRFIRKVFNTNPTLVNTEVASTAQRKNYWLGESYEKFVEGKIGTLSATDRLAATLVPLKEITGTGVNPRNFNFKSQNSKTGWVFSQHLDASGSFPSTESEYLTTTDNKIEANTKKLFRFVSMGKGEFEQENYKILISNIKPPKQLLKYGTFDVIVAKINSTDSELAIVEQFNNVSLDKSSNDYIARKIGDKYVSWNYNEERFIEYGEFDNNSSVIRVEMSEGIENGQYGENLLPFGFYGPPRPSSITVYPAQTASTDIYAYSGSYYLRSATGGVNDNGLVVYNFTSSAGGRQLTSSIVFPCMPLVTTVNKDISDTNSNYFGINKGIKDYTVGQYNLFHNDILRPLGKSGLYDASGSFEYSFIFTLDDVKAVNSSKTGSWGYGNRYAGTSYTAINGNGALPVDSSALTSRLSINKFAMNLYGGFDGLDVKEVEAFKNAAMEEKDELTSYTYNTYKVAIESVNDAEVVNMNLLTVPGLTNKNLTKLMVDVCQQRGDSMAIIDLEDDFIPSHENISGYVNIRQTSPKEAISSLKERNINSSYGAAYFPWVKMSVSGPQRDPKDVWVPPSVVALGTYASSEAKTQLWFAPAGFNRGGLKELDSRGKYTAGFKVIDTATRLTSRHRDDLYEANINPIANFVNEGIVVFGQKTLQILPSALDRINVRRLLIYLKKKISIIASSILFDANVDVTWKRFVSASSGFLQEVKSGLGIEDYKVVLDNTTTTPDLVDRNILYAKIYLKPTRAIEYIAIDFVITKSGASFSD